jgi:hypothetical protein
MNARVVQIEGELLLAFDLLRDRLQIADLDPVNLVRLRTMAHERFLCLRVGGFFQLAQDGADSWHGCSRE